MLALSLIHIYNTFCRRRGGSQTAFPGHGTCLLYTSYAREKEKDWGISITLDIQNADQSQFTQNDQMENFIEEGCDLACINLVDRTDASIIIEKAKSNHVPVIFFNRELVEEDLERWEELYYVGADACLLYTSRCV